MPNLPLISVIMPCFNGEKFLDRSISSVLEQTYSNIELIVVNDGSTDGSIDIIKEVTDPRLTFIDQENAGVCRARNSAITQASGKFIAFLDADDTWEADFLSKLYQPFSSENDLAITYCGWQNIGLPDGRAAPFIPPNYESLNKKELLFAACPWPIHAALTRKSEIDNVGGFDESLLTSEDFLLWLKIAIHKPIRLVPEVLAYYHHHNGLQATENRGPAAINHWKAQRLFLQHESSFKARIDPKTGTKIMYAELLKRGYECYWKRDLVSARMIFRAVMKNGYGTLTDWKYMLPSLLPISIHSLLIRE